MRFSSASRLQGSAGLLIKQKLAAQGKQKSAAQDNIEETSGRLADAAKLGHRLPEPTWCPVSEIRDASQLARISEPRGP
jgi:hypothetical protein